MTTLPVYVVSVLDEQTGARLPWANIAEVSASGYTGRGTTTDGNGVASVPIGTHEFRYVGYEPRTVDVAAPLAVTLAPKVELLDEFEIVATRRARYIVPLLILAALFTITQTKGNGKGKGKGGR